MKIDCITGRPIKGPGGCYEYQKRHPNNFKMNIEMNDEEVDLDE